MSLSKHQSLLMGPKSLRSCSMASVIPIDIFASEILPRLPPSTLLRFKCLNKFFYDYISSKQFIDLQVHHSAVSHTSSPLIVSIARMGGRECLYLLDVDSPGSPARYFRVPLQSPEQHRSLMVVGCCNGLLCLKSSASVCHDAWCYAMIVNPSTGSILSNISLAIGMAYKSCIGFGYHNLDKDYKLVVVEYHYHRESPNLKTLLRLVSIFSMKSNSWRCIETACLGSPPLMSDSQICLPSSSGVTCALIDNYLMHWLFKSSAGSRSLVCFNLEKQGWVADIPLPDFDDYDRDRGVVLGVLDGCLCVSVYEYYVYPDKFNVWIMKEYGVHASWTKLIIDIPGHCEYYPISACQHAAIKEILLVKRWPEKRGIRTYVWYNIRDKTTKELHVHGAPMSTFACRELVAHSLCLGSLANCFGDFQTQKCKGTPKWMEIMKIDDEVKILQANMNNRGDHQWPGPPARSNPTKIFKGLGNEKIRIFSSKPECGPQEPVRARRNANIILAGLGLAFYTQARPDPPM